jgi:hypothetical protein
VEQSIRTSLLFAAAILMIFGAVANAIVVVPDLHGDLIEIGVRPSVLGSTVLGLYFGGLAMFGFAAIVSTAAIQATRGIVTARIPLAIVAVIYGAIGIVGYSRSHNLHHLAPGLMGALIGIAITIPKSR